MYMRLLGLQSRTDWEEWARSSTRPRDIPSKPYRAYAGQGWVSVGDWLGTGRVADQLRKYRPFAEARDFARSLGLSSHSEWRTAFREGKVPDDTPAKPDRTYRTQGWVSWGDWLGTGRIADRLKQYRPFAEAREFVRTLNLTRQMEWYEYARSGNKPADIPTAPDQVYANEGWVNFGDWLGTGRGE
jgi:hypothetical protein